MDTLDSKLNEFYAGKVVRKDLTKSIREGTNVPSYVLEYLLGMYCATDNEEDIERGVAMVKQVLANNFVRPDEAEKIKSKIRERGQYKISTRYRPSSMSIMTATKDRSSISTSAVCILTTATSRNMRNCFVAVSGAS